MYLSFYDAMIKRLATVVDCDVRDNICNTGFRIDLDLRNMTTVRERRPELTFRDNIERMGALISKLSREVFKTNRTFAVASRVNTARVINLGWLQFELLRGQ